MVEAIETFASVLKVATAIGVSLALLVGLGLVAAITILPHWARR